MTIIITLGILPKQRLYYLLKAKRYVNILLLPKTIKVQLFTSSGLSLLKPLNARNLRANVDIDDESATLLAIGKGKILFGVILLTYVREFNVTVGLLYL